MILRLIINLFNNNNYFKPYQESKKIGFLDFFKDLPNEFPPENRGHHSVH
jgi:hypothetical protein